MTESDKKQFTFNYVHPDGLRDLYINGAWGGITPRKEIFMHFYSERQPIPVMVTHEIDENGKLLNDGEQKLAGDAIRLIQASVVMGIDTAIAIRDLLSKMIELGHVTPDNGPKLEE